MKRLLLVHNLVHGQSVVHELDDMDFAVELVEGDPETDDQGEMDVESRFFIRVDNELSRVDLNADSSPVRSSAQND